MLGFVLVLAVIAWIFRFWILGFLACAVAYAIAVGLYNYVVSLLAAISLSDWCVMLGAVIATLIVANKMLRPQAARAAVAARLPGSFRLGKWLVTYR